MDTRHIFIGTLLVALASPGWSQAAPDQKPVVPTPDESCDLSCASSPGECMPYNRCPCAYAEVEWLFLKRSSGHTDRTILINGNTQEPLVSSSDLNFDFNSGVRALVGFQLWGCVPVEFGYFGLFDSVASLNYVQPNPNVDVTLPGRLGVASNVFHNNVAVQADYRSRIQGAEVNFPFCFSCDDSCAAPCETSCVTPCAASSVAYARSTTWFAGFRYLNLGEDLLISGAKPVGAGIETGYYDTNSSNSLYGGQVGVRIRRGQGKFGWEGTGKIGLFYNQAGQEQVFVDYPNFLLRPPVSANRGTTAFASELNLTGIYQLNDTWGLRAGYSVIWIEGVALAPDQLDFSITSTSGTGLNTGGGLLLHGVNVGLEARW